MSIHSWKPRAIFVNSEPEAIGRDDAVGDLPAELLGRLEGQGLRALGVVRAHVDVDERPRVLARDLGAQPVDVVVVALDGDEVRAVDPRGEDLLLLEVGGDEDVGLEAERGGVGGHGVGQVAGRGAGDDLVAELAGALERDGDDAVLERVRRVGGVVLDVHLADPEPLGEPVGLEQRREAGREAAARAAPRSAGSRGSARCSAVRPGCGGAVPRRRSRRARARRRPPGDRSTARTRSSRRADRRPGIPCT